jgi:site-specific DNA-methyltransferase (adenine-specific)
MIQLINGEAVTEMKKLQDNSIDFVLIDPPYKLDNHGGGKNGFKDRKLVKDLHIDFISKGFDVENVFNEIERLQPTLNAVIFCSNKQVSEIMSFWERKKKSVTLLVWQKTNPTPLSNGKYISDLEFMVFVRGKKAIYNSIGYKDQLKTFTYPAPSSKKRIHPTEKPQEILERLIKIHSNEESTVLDCFGGSFSTGLSCLKLNRNFIGIEIDEDIYNTAKKRMEEKKEEKENKQLPLFNAQT